MRHSVPAPVDDAIDSIVDAVSSGARISPGVIDDTSSPAMRAVTLPSTSGRPWVRSPAVRRTGPLLIAFAVGLGGAVWGLRSFEPIDPRPDPNPLPVERDARPAPRPERRADLLTSRGLQPLARFASPAVSHPLAIPEPEPPAINAPIAPLAPRQARTVQRVVRKVPAPALDTTASVAMTLEPIVPVSAAPIETRTETAAPTVEREAIPIDAEALDTRAVRETVDDYAEALEQLDVNAAAALWPSVDRRALGRAFASLKSQTVAFEDCDVELANPTAIARCHGTAEYIVKIGGSTPRTGRFEWLFRMRKRADVWRIEGVSASQAGSLRDQ